MTMKKQYIQPQMLVVKMNLTGMMCTSFRVRGEYEEGKMDDLSRESVWGNEEGEEESNFWF